MNDDAPSYEDWSATTTGVVERLRSLIEALRMPFAVAPGLTTGGIVIRIVLGSLPAVAAWAFKEIVDWLAEAPNRSSNIADIVPFLLLSAAASVTTAWVSQFEGFIDQEVGRRVDLDVQQRVFSQLLSHRGLRNFERPRMYDVIGLASNGARHAGTASVSGSAELLQSSVTVTSFIAVLWVLDPFVTLLAVTATIPQLVEDLVVSQQRVGLAEHLSYDTRRKGYLAHVLSSARFAKEIRLWNAGRRLLGELTEQYRSVNRALRRQDYRELGWQLVTSLTAALAGAGILFLVVRRATLGSVTVGDVTLYVSSVAGLQMGLGAMFGAIGSLNEVALYFSLFKRLDGLPDELDIGGQDPPPRQPLDHTIEFQNVWFRYGPEKPWVLRGLNLRVPHGETVALVGENGVGKSTIVKLLMRMYDPDDGRILWGGVDLRKLDLTTLREHIAAVFQDFCQFDSSLYDNVAIGHVQNWNDADRVAWAVHVVGLDDVVSSLEAGLNTTLSLAFGDGSTGVDLSGGQWQRVVLARALVGDPDVLVLDEPSAALDPAAEETILTTLSQASERRSIILISHRRSTVRYADRIVVLRGGKVAEEGPEAALLRRGSQYRRLFHSQLSAAEAMGTVSAQRLSRA